MDNVCICKFYRLFSCSILSTHSTGTLPGLYLVSIAQPNVQQITFFIEKFVAYPELPLKRGGDTLRMTSLYLSLLGIGTRVVIIRNRHESGHY